MDMKTARLLAVALCALAAPAHAEIPRHEVRIATPDPEVVLAGTLLVPAGAETAVLMVTGSGGHPRDQVISGTPMFRVIAEHLAAAGVATLRLDDRGVGESTGPAARASTTADRVEDMRAALRWLQGTDLGRFSRIGLLGHSEGANISARLGAGGEAVDFLILLGAPALPGREVWVDQQLAGFRAAVGTEDAALLEDVAAHLQRAVDLSVEGAPAEAMRDNTIALFALAGIDTADEEGQKLLAGFTGRMSDPWMRHFLADDPGVALGALATPLLVVYGSHDRLTSTRANGPPLVAALAAAGNADFTLRVLPDEDHFFMRAPGRAPGEHAFGEMEMSAALLHTLTGWLQR